MSRSSRADETPESPQRTRRHRPREETRALLLAAATRLAVARTNGGAPGHNVLADIRITDVLSELNSTDRSRRKPMTTGAFYQIWSDQASFQHELLQHIMDETATSGSVEIEQLAFRLVAQGLPADEVFRQVVDLAFSLNRESPEIYLALGLGALTPVELVRTAQSDATARYIATLDRLFEVLLAYAGRRLRPGWTMDDVIWATEAVVVGYLLRARTNPGIPDRTDADGQSAHTTATLSIIEGFTEPIDEDDADDRARR